MKLIWHMIFFSFESMQNVYFFQKAANIHQLPVLWRVKKTEKHKTVNLQLPIAKAPGNDISQPSFGAYLTIDAKYTSITLHTCIARSNSFQMHCVAAQGRKTKDGSSLRPRLYLAVKYIKNRNIRTTRTFFQPLQQMCPCVATD